MATPPDIEAFPALAQPALDGYAHAPLGMVEQAGTRMFPHATVEHLRQLVEQGWHRFGVASAVVNESGEILMLEHAESTKLTEGAQGPLMETVRVNPHAGLVESTEQTFYRSVIEELGIEDPTALKPKARLVGGWTLHAWQAGDKKPDEIVFGVNPVVVIPDEKAKKIGRFINTDEIRRAEFKPVEAISTDPKLRPGVLGWLGGLTSRGLLDKQHGVLHPLHFDVDALSEPGWADAVFANVDL